MDNTENTKEFLRFLHHNDEIHFRAIRSSEANVRAINKYGTFESLQAELAQLNSEDYGIYFVVNRGGTKRSQISEICAFYVDFDIQNKSEALAILKAYRNAPSVVVESKRSIHAYWVLNTPYRSDDRLERFECVQRGLNLSLSSDASVRSAERLMALPGFYHCKDPSDRFLVQIIETSGVVYTFGDFLEEEGRGRAEIEIQSKRTSKQNSKGGYKCVSYTPALVASCAPKAKIVVPSKHEAIRYLRTLDIATHLGTPRSILCPFHDDSMPSASIFEGENGISLLKCHACQTTWNIFTLTMQLNSESFSSSLQRLMAQYGLSFDVERFRSNRMLIEPRTLRADYPHIYSVTRWYLGLLQQMHDLIEKQFAFHGCVDAEGNPCAVASYRYIANELSQSHQKLAKKLKILASTGLINCLGRKEVDQDLAAWAANCNKMGRYASLWSIPKYTPELLQQIEQTVETAKALGHTSLSRSSTVGQLRSEGVAAASRISPQSKLDATQDRAFNTLLNASRSFVIQRGYFRETEVLDSVAWFSTGSKRLAKQLRPAIIKELDLVPLQLNRIEKERLRVDCDGYPRVWVPRI